MSFTWPAGAGGCPHDSRTRRSCHRSPTEAPSLVGEQYQRRLVESIRDLTPDQLALRAAPKHWPVWASPSHTARFRGPGPEAVPYERQTGDGTVPGARGPCRGSEHAREPAGTRPVAGPLSGARVRPLATRPAVTNPGRSSRTRRGTLGSAPASGRVAPIGAGHPIRSAGGTAGLGCGQQPPPSPRDR